MRILLPAAATLIFCMSASAQSYSHEPDTYRHGGTYSTVQSSSEQACAETCRADTKCLVWSFRKPNTAAGPSQCELKQTIGHAEENALMTSGVSPRFSEQQQAVVAPPSSSGLLGGTSSQTRHATRTLSRNSTRVQAPINRPAPTIRRRQAVVQTPAAPTQIRESAFSAPASQRVATPRPAGRVLSPNDPRIIRNHSSQTRVTTSAGAGQTQQVQVPVRQVAPPQPAQPRQPAQRAPRTERPYDSLRNREFPRYSVQDGVALDADTAESTGTEAAGSGS
jgi:hypothetical protein